MLRFSAFELDLRTHELRKNGRQVRLQEQPFQALRVLLARPGELVTREELRTSIWPADTFVDFDLSLNTAIRRLRIALGDEAETPIFIQTIPRQGYRFIAPVIAVSNGDSSTPQAPPNVSPVSVATDVETMRRPRYLVPLLASIVLVLVGIAFQKPIAARFRGADGTAGRAVDPDVQRSYAMGRYEGAIWTKEDLSLSVKYFDEALRKDPNYAPAWAGLADSQLLLSELGFVPGAEANEKAKSAALAAIKLDDSLPEAHAAMGQWLTHVAWSWPRAEAELRRAIALGPDCAEAHQWYGYYLISQARHDEAIAEMLRARSLEPSSVNKLNSLAAAYYYAKRYDDALRVWDQATAVDGNTGRRHLRLAFVYEQKDMRAESMAERIAFLRSRNDNESAENVERTYRNDGYNAAKRVFLQRDLKMLAAAGSTPDSEFRAAADYAELRQPDRALDHLEAAVTGHATGALYLAVDPQLESLRSNARFGALLRTIGLPAK